MSVFDFQDSPIVERMPSNKNMRVKRNSGTKEMCCIRTTLITFNLATGLAGVCVVAVGFMLLTSTYSNNQLVSIEELEGGNGTQQVAASIVPLVDVHESPMDEYMAGHGKKELTTLILLCLSFGTLMALISFVGCFGACISSTCLLMTYVFSVVAVVIFQLFISIFAIVYRQPVSNYIREELSKTLKGYKYNNDTVQTWDSFHTRFGCCGVDSYSDWFSPDDQIVPDSCCIDIQPGCGRTVDPTLWQKKGCLAQMQYFAFEHLHILAFFIVVVVFLQLYGIIASTLLFYHVRTPKGPQLFKDYRYERANM